LNVIVTAGQSETQPPFGTAAQGVGQGKIVCLDVNPHRVLRCNVVVVSRARMINGFDDQQKSKIIAILIENYEVRASR